MISEHTLAVIQHVAGFTDTALPAGGGTFCAGSHTAAIRVHAGRLAGGKAVDEQAVFWALQSYEVEGDKLLEMT